MKLHIHLSELLSVGWNLKVDVKCNVDYSDFLKVFTVRHYALHGLCDRNSVCLSVRLSVKSYYRLLIGNHTLAFDWCHFWWPWGTFEGHFSLGCHFHVHFSYPWHAFTSHGLPAIAELLVHCNFIALCFTVCIHEYHVILLYSPYGNYFIGAVVSATLAFLTYFIIYILYFCLFCVS